MTKVVPTTFHQSLFCGVREPGKPCRECGFILRLLRRALSETCGAHHGAEQLFLVLEMTVDCLYRDSSKPCDAVHRRLGVAAFEETLPCRGYDGGALLLHQSALRIVC